MLPTPPARPEAMIWCSHGRYGTRLIQPCTCPGSTCILECPACAHGGTRGNAPSATGCTGNLPNGVAVQAATAKWRRVARSNRQMAWRCTGQRARRQAVHPGLWCTRQLHKCGSGGRVCAITRLPGGKLRNRMAVIATIERLTAPQSVNRPNVSWLTAIVHLPAGAGPRPHDWRLTKLVAVLYDELIDGLAGEQLGLVTRAQLCEHGMPPAAVDSRVRARRLRQLHRGVYRVGPLVVTRARELAALLACGPHACISHGSAGFLWQLMPDPSDDMPVEISLAQGHRGRRPAIRVHRVSLHADEVTTLDCIRLTTLSRTLVDLAAMLDRRGLERVLAQAERVRQLDRSKLQDYVASCAGRPGVPLLRSLICDEIGPAFTRSEAESRFLALMRKAELPAPETNVRVGEYEVDFLWRSERLVVEVDGIAYHSSSGSFESDRRRDARLTACGLTVVRVTWNQIVREPEAMLVRLAQTFARNGLEPVHNGSQPRLPRDRRRHARLRT